MTEPIRVLCVFSSLDRGGAESMCMNLYRHIDRSKVQFDFVKHFSTEGAFEKEIQELGGRIFEAPRYRVWNHWQYCQWWEHFFQQHLEYKIIHGHFFTISPIYFKVAKKYGLVTVAHSHASKYEGTDVKEQLKIHLLKSIEKVSDYRFACGRNAGAWLFPGGDFEVFPNAIDTEKFRFNPETRQRIRSAHGLDDRFVVGTVGNIAKVKNPFGIINIVKQLVQVEPNAMFVWIGRNEEWKAVIERCLKENNLNSHFLMLGVQNNVHEWLQSLDVFILPSLSEGLPVVAIEAQAAGLPCVFSDAIDRSVAITDLCDFLPIDDYQVWAERIRMFKNFERCDMSENIRNAGFEVQDTACKLQEFYINCYEKACGAK